MSREVASDAFLVRPAFVGLRDQDWSTISILLSKASLRLQDTLDAPSSAPETVKI
ncbi:uncharacterized protein RAG0_15013 [Rhynchosporium agropyri]|uniref:Uncharacterized protein n=1 Tax=Rhynchosporium agropyri TaxID=914238 RepID=A0A1E1LJG5_9HELO|nr:uncharacterized protein RAG0_15013 [Rhynchosporium agropyri]